jgi:hypothetical protein
MTPFKYTLLCAAIAATFCALAFLPGCQSAAYLEGDYVGQGLRATADIPATPGAVVSTHEDGTVTVQPIPLAPVPTATLPLVAAPAPAPSVSGVSAPKPSPVVAVTVIQPTPGKSFSYTITPESQKGDKLGASRMVTWAGEAPGTVVEKVATQKIARTHNPLPAVTVDETGIHAAAGGGSKTEQAGESWWQRLCVWFSDTLKGWVWWIVVIGIAVAAFFILPILVPALAPLFASIAGAFHGAWTYITGEIGKLIAWLKTVHIKTTSPTASASTPAPASITPSTPVSPTSPASSPAATPAQVTVQDSAVVAHPPVATPAPVADVVSTLK